MDARHASRATHPASVSVTIRLIEISADVPFTVATAVGFQLLDTVVHTWDVAAALGTDFRPDDELALVDRSARWPVDTLGDRTERYAAGSK